MTCAIHEVARVPCPHCAEAHAATAAIIEADLASRVFQLSARRASRARWGRPSQSAIAKQVGLTKARVSQLFKRGVSVEAILSGSYLRSASGRKRKSAPLNAGSAA